MNKNDIHRLADSKNIAWDNDPVFKMICKCLTGKSHLDEMGSLELKKVYEELVSNPSVFSQNNASMDGLVFKQNHDYDTGNFLDRVRQKLWKPYNN
jgi:hypothetical protein